MTTRNFGQVELDIDDYTNFLMGYKRGEYIYPVKTERVYVASELPPFFENAQIELERLLSHLIPVGKPVTISNKEKIMYEFHLIGHGKTGTNKEEKLTGWSGDMLCSTYEKNGKHELGGIGLALAQAGIIPDDKISQKIIQETGIKKINLDDYTLCFVSDLPRAIHHALLLIGNDNLTTNLYGISARISQEMVEKGNIFDKSIYHDLIKLAIENGFIPTPLLRAQYYGPMELLHEKLKDKDRGKFVEQMVNETLENHRSAGKKHEFNLNEVRAEANDLADALIQRKDLLFAHRSKGGRYITEDRFDLLHRLGHFYDTIIKKIGEKNKILVITSSGCIDLSPFYFRYLGHPDRIEVKTPKEKVRGKVVVIKLTEHDNKLHYINDPIYIENILEATDTAITDFRAHSHDEQIKRGNGIVRAEFFALNKDKEGKDEQNAVSLEEILKSNEPILVIGNCGLGKTTFSLYLASRLMPNSDKLYSGLYQDERYIPILVRLRNVSDAVSKEPQQDHRVGLIRHAISGGVLELPNISLDEFKKEGYKFVFILDGYDELHNNYRDSFSNMVEELRKQGNVVVTSRLGIFSEYEHNNRGYKTVNIDHEAIVRNLDDYLNSRNIPEIKRFKEFLLNQANEIKKNWLMISLLTKMYTSAPSEIDLTSTISPQEVLYKGIRHFVWEHGLERDPSLFQGMTDIAKKQAKEVYLAQVMPIIQRIAAYMTVTDQSVISPQEIQLIIDGKWTLKTELAYRQGKGPRFLE